MRNKDNLHTAENKAKADRSHAIHASEKDSINENLKEYSKGRKSGHGFISPSQEKPAENPDRLTGL
jgi:hypothetical protein